MQHLPTQQRTIRARQKHHTRRHLARLPRPPHRRRETLLRRLIHRRVHQRRPHGARRDGVAADALRDPLVAEAAGEAHDGALCGGVVEEVRAADVGVDAGVVNDGVAFAEVGEGIFGEVEEGWDWSVDLSHNMYGKG